MNESKIRILLAKPGLDGHDKGAKIVALALRDAGMEVIYTGLHQSVEEIMHTAIQEAVDIIGLSVMSGAHLPICKELLAMLAREQMTDVRVVVGGVIPAKDISALKAMGIAGVFPGGTPFEAIVKQIYALFDMAPPQQAL
jgi:methylmalonyl-CoA mutase C-terminal domain/subunit